MTERTCNRICYWIETVTLGCAGVAAIVAGIAWLLR